MLKDYYGLVKWHLHFTCFPTRSRTSQNLGSWLGFPCLSEPRYNEGVVGFYCTCDSIGVGIPEESPLRRRLSTYPWRHSMMLLTYILRHFAGKQIYKEPQCSDRYMCPPNHYTVNRYLGEIPHRLTANVKCAISLS